MTKLRYMESKTTAEAPLALYLIFAIFSTLVSTLAYADDFLAATSLNDLLNMDLEIKSATKTSQLVSDATSPVTVISRAQLDSTGASSIIEALRTVAGVNVRWNQMMQTITIRGFGQNPFSNRVLFLIDGIPYNSWNKGGFPQQPGLDFFNINNVHQIEVIKGPGAALYGENAYWGVINIVSRNGRDIDGTIVSTKFGDRQTREVGVQVGKPWGDGDWLASVKWVKSQFPTQLWLETADAEVRASEVFLKTNIGGSSLSYYRLEDRVDGFESPLPAVTPTAVFRSAEEIEQKVEIWAGQFSKMTSYGHTISSNMSYAKRDGSHCAACHSPTSDEYSTEIADHGYQAFGDLNLELAVSQQHTVLAGVEVRRINSGDHDVELGDSPNGTHSNFATAYNKWAYYIQDEWAINDHWHITTGIRTDEATEPELFSEYTSPRIESLYVLNEQLRFRGGWGRARHYPDFSTLYQNTWFAGPQNTGIPGMDSFPFAVFIPNPALEPEQIDTWTLGLESNFRDGWLFKLDTFWSKVENFHVMLLTPPASPMSSPGVTWQNHPDQGIVKGFESELRWSNHKGIGGLINWSWQTHDTRNGFLDATGKPMEFLYAPQNKVSLALYFEKDSISTPFWREWFGNVEISWKDHASIPSAWIDQSPTPIDDRLPPYALVDLKIGRSLPFMNTAGKKPFEISFIAKNILNETSCETFNLAPCQRAGREFFLSLKYELSESD